LDFGALSRESAGEKKKKFSDEGGAASTLPGANRITPPTFFQSTAPLSLPSNPPLENK
jgi:hypothetical protein